MIFQIITYILIVTCCTNNIIGNPTMEYGLINAFGGNNQGNPMINQVGLYMGANAGNDIAENAMTYSMLSGNPPNSNIGMYVLADEARNGNANAQKLLDYQVMSNLVNLFYNGQTQQQSQPQLLQSIRQPNNLYNGMNDIQLVQAASIDNDSAQMEFEARMMNGSIEPMNKNDLNLLAQSAAMGNDYAKDLLQYQKEQNNVSHHILESEHKLNKKHQQQNIQQTATQSNAPSNKSTPTNESLNPLAGMNSTFQLITAASMDSDAAQAALELGQRTASIPAMNAQELALLSQSAMLGNDYSKDMLEYQGIIRLVDRTNARATQPLKQINPLYQQQVNSQSQPQQTTVGGISLPSIDYSKINTMGLINQATMDNDAAKNILNYGMMTGGVKPMNYLELALLKTQTQGGNDYAKDMLAYQSNIMGMPGLFNTPQAILQQSNPNGQSNESGGTKTDLSNNDVVSNTTENTDLSTSSNTSTSVNSSENTSSSTNTSTSVNSSIPTNTSTSTVTSNNIMNITGQDLRGMYMMKGKIEKVAEFDMLSKLINSGQLGLNGLYIYSTQRDSAVASDMISIEVLNHASKGNLGGTALGAQYIAENDLAQDLIKYKALSAGLNNTNNQNIATQYAFSSMLDVGVQDLMMYKLVPKMLAGATQQNTNQSETVITNSSESTNVSTSGSIQPSNSNSTDKSTNGSKPTSMILMTDLRGVYLMNGQAKKMATFDMLMRGMNQGTIGISTLILMNNEVSKDMVQVHALQHISNNLSRAATMAMLSTTDGIGQDLMRYITVKNMAGGSGVVQAQNKISNAKVVTDTQNKFTGTSEIQENVETPENPVTPGETPETPVTPVLRNKNPSARDNISNPKEFEIVVDKAKEHYRTLLYIVIGVILVFSVGGSFLLYRSNTKKTKSSSVDYNDKYTIVMDPVDTITGEKSKILKV